MSPPEVTPDRQSHTPGPVSLPPAPPSASPLASPPAVLVFMIQLAALATVFRGLPQVLGACLEATPPPLAWKILIGMGGAIVLIAAPTPSIKAVVGAVMRSREK
jgi:hypothetical protein